MSRDAGDWIETFSGVKFWPLSADPADVRLRDIAHALSLQCRFAGHTRSFVSVGEHCLNCYRLAKELNYTNRERLFALLHDAAEAYIGDLPRPIKLSVDNFKDVEHKLELVIWEAFGIEPPTKYEWATVKYIDNVILGIEGQKYMNNVDGWIDELPVCPIEFEYVEYGWQYADIEFEYWADKLLEIAKGDGCVNA